MSPLHGDLGGLPPLFVSVGDDEAMLDDSVGFAGKVRQAGGEVSLSVGAGMVHCYPALSPLFPEATAALDEVCAFIRGRIRP